MGLLECICGYGVAPTADDRIAKAMQTFNLKARPRRPVGCGLHWNASSPSDFESLEGVGAVTRSHAPRRKKI